MKKTLLCSCNSSKNIYYDARNARTYSMSTVKSKDFTDLTPKRIIREGSIKRKIKLISRTNTFLESILDNLLIGKTSRIHNFRGIKNI